MITSVKIKASISEIQQGRKMRGLSRALKILHGITVAISALARFRTAKLENYRTATNLTKNVTVQLLQRK